MTVARHRTAMRRSFLSRPLQRAHADGLLVPHCTLFDYGCGRGDDIRILNRLGIAATGWDPAHAPAVPKRNATIVNLGYVVNVIEDPSERAETLQDAWRLADSALIVSARLRWDPDSDSGLPHRDGLLTTAGTFQKFFEPDELKAWVEATLRTRAVTAAPGMLYVFRDEKSAQRLLALHSRTDSQPRQLVAEVLYEQQSELLGELRDFVAKTRRLPTAADLASSALLISTFGSLRSAFAVVRKATGPRLWEDVNLGSRRRSEQTFEEHLDDLQPLIDFVTVRGRLPRPHELKGEDALREVFGSIPAAFSLVRRVTGPQRWSEYEDQARDNFVVYAALAAFTGRPPFAKLPEELKCDVRDLFGSYKAACTAADKLLYSIADVRALDSACRTAAYGKLTSEALYVHTSGLQYLSPLLRVYIGAARTLTGTVEEAAILKLHRAKAQVSFLSYPSFDRDPHPELVGSVVARLPLLRVSYKDFGSTDNPPILHRKEAFVPAAYPRRATFERLTLQEERAGLLGGTNTGRRQEWHQLLSMKGYRLQGHRLVKAS